MSYLAETTVYEDGIYQLETSDPVMGGPEGVDNRQAKQLANRTAWLKEKVSVAQGGLDTHLAAVDPHTQYATKVGMTGAIEAAVAALVNSSPETLDTLKALADALGDDPNFATTMMDALALKAPFKSPAFTDNPSAPTPPQFDNSQKLATTDFVQRALGSLSGFTSVSASCILTLAQLGTHVQISGVTPDKQTYALPSINGLPSGVGYWITNNSFYPQTIKASGSEQITPLGQSFVLQSQETAFVFVQATAQWCILGAISALVFGATLATNGYQKLPSGLILQWGNVFVSTANSTVTVTLPIAFPIALCLNPFATGASATGFAYSNNNGTASQIVVGSTVGNNTISWFAIGH
jgi:hypothetical protein